MTRPRSCVIASAVCLLAIASSCSSLESLDPQIVGRWSNSRFNLVINDDGTARTNTPQGRYVGVYSFDSRANPKRLRLQVSNEQTLLDQEYEVTFLGPDRLKLQAIVDSERLAQMRRGVAFRILTRRTPSENPSATQLSTDGVSSLPDS